MDLGLKGKVALVTGASAGLGRAVALEFAREGAAVMIASRSKEKLQQAAEEISGLTGAEVAFCPADVSKTDDIDHLLKTTLNRFGRLDVLVANAGGPSTGTFADFEDDAWEQAFQTNLMSVVRLVRGAIPHLRASGSGRILNIASTSIKQPIEGLVLSNVYRAGVFGLTKTLATELAPDNILINTIAPGRISTDRIRQTLNYQASVTGMSVEELKLHSQKEIPLGRLGEPEEFAKVAVFLGSGANTYVTGQGILVDGGMVKAL